jgi:tRNA threonylcarbamoyladenosine biosynthesis protein TsaE
LHEEHIVSHSPEETRAIAARLVRALPHKTLIALHGELGSGKTCFVQGIADELNLQKTITSPTFTVINEYQAKRPLYHIDLYRMNGPDEMIGIGLDDYLEADGITAIEWAERAGQLIPATAVHLYLAARLSPEERSITIISASPVMS